MNATYRGYRYVVTETADGSFRYEIYRNDVLVVSGLGRITAAIAEALVRRVIDEQCKLWALAVISAVTGAAA